MHDVTFWVVCMHCLLTRRNSSTRDCIATISTAGCRHHGETPVRQPLVAAAAGPGGCRHCGGFSICHMESLFSAVPWDACMPEQTHGICLAQRWALAQDTILVAPQLNVSAVKQSPKPGSPLPQCSVKADSAPRETQLQSAAQQDCSHANVSRSSRSLLVCFVV